MTEVEKFIFTCDETHSLLGVTFAVGMVRLAVAPWSNSSVVTFVVFQQARPLSIATYQDLITDAEMQPPRDIIGIDSRKLTEDRWEFIVGCNAIQFSWQSNWPTYARDDFTSFSVPS